MLVPVLPKGYAIDTKPVRHQEAKSGFLQALQAVEGAVGAGKKDFKEADFDWHWGKIQTAHLCVAKQSFREARLRIGFSLVTISFHVNRLASWRTDPPALIKLGVSQRHLKCRANGEIRGCNIWTVQSAFARGKSEKKSETPSRSRLEFRRTSAPSWPNERYPSLTCRCLVGGPSIGRQLSLLLPGTFLLGPEILCTLPFVGPFRSGRR